MAVIISLYDSAKQQIEIEYQAETAEARSRRQAKLDALEQLRPTLHSVEAAKSPEIETPAENEDQSVEGNQGNHTETSFSQRVKNEVLSAIDDMEKVATPLIYDRLIAKYPDVRSLKAVNVKSVIAKHLKKLADAGSISLVSRGVASEPNIYARRVPTLILGRDIYVPPISLLGPKNANNDFVLAEAVREAIKEFNGSKFDVSSLFKKLQERYPAHVTAAKKRSVSATVSNLFNKGGLQKGGLRGGRMTYRVKPEG